jgi:hypothetical protein
MDGSRSGNASSEKRYFVVRLGQDDRMRKEGWLFEIQLLDDEGRGVEFGYLRGEEQEITIAGERIPPEVVLAARRQTEGQGDYVDAHGRSVPPFAYPAS